MCAICMVMRNVYEPTFFYWLCIEEVIDLTMCPAPGNKIRTLLIQGGRFLLTQLGYVCQDELQNVRYYRIMWGLLVSYILISLRALVYNDPLSIVINLIWTLQIFVSLWGNHRDYINDQKKAAEEMAIKNNAVPIKRVVGKSPWGVRMVLYLVVLLVNFLSTTYQIFIGNWGACGNFSVCAFVIALIDGGIEVLIGLFDATVDM